jgi:hypothetical protein
MDEAGKEGAATTAPVTQEAPKAQPVFIVEADGARVRTLLKPIIGHEGPIQKIRLRKPTYRDVMTMGDPETLVVVEGGYVPQIDMTLIERYIVALSGVDQLLLEQMDYMDALALRDAVRSFFQRVR